MQATKILQEIVKSGLEQLGLAWWIEIVTTKPHCTYYFGPFASHEEFGASAQPSGWAYSLYR